LFLLGTDRRGYLGFLGILRLLGALHLTEVRIFLTRVPWAPLTILFWAERAFLTAPFLAFLLGAGFWTFLGSAGLGAPSAAGAGAAASAAGSAAFFWAAGFFFPVLGFDGDEERSHRARSA